MEQTSLKHKSLKHTSVKLGGAGRNRTDDGGVAVHSITTLLPRLLKPSLSPVPARHFYLTVQGGGILGNIPQKSTT